MSHHALQVEAYDTEVVRIVEDVLTTMTNYTVRDGNTAYTVQPGRATCAIYFTGIWNGAVLIECPMAMAFEFTARLMDIPKPVQFDNDVFDAMGELVNMVGGNLKSVLPRGVSLSLPSVVEGSSYSVRVGGANHLRRFSFDGPDGPFWVTLVETETPPS